jgi:tRNA threonylcarbamoyl adenosine modification protein (Sua5/YciO/YrdC/YwlC family)
MKKITINPSKVDFSLLKEAVKIIKEGGIVAIPTETVYGLAARADKEEVVERLYDVKQRDRAKPFSYVVDNVKKAIDGYFSVLPPFGYRLIENFWPGPLTIVYYSLDEKKIGVRVPSHVIAQYILREVNCAVYLPSANISGQKEVSSAEDVENIFNGNIDLIVDGGKSLYSKASTVIDLTYHPFKILREGVVTEKEIIETFIKKRILFVCTGNTCRSPMAEFLLKKYLLEKKPYLSQRYQIISRGTFSLDGQPASSIVIDIMREKEGLEMNGFSSNRLNREIILSSDLIFTMEDTQKDYVLKIEPTAEGRVFNLKKFLPPDLEKDIPDPIGKNYKFYEEVYSLIKKAILELKEWL